jgi:rhodanese-related sulfurtransferase
MSARSRRTKPARCHYSLNIPIQQLRERIAELDASRPVYLYCRSGFRSYLAYRMLTGHGFERVATLSGGTMTMEHAVPWLAPEFERPPPRS